MYRERQHLIERLGLEHISWCLQESWEQLQERIHRARAGQDYDLALCYQQLCQLKRRHHRNGSR